MVDSIPAPPAEFNEAVGGGDFTLIGRILFELVVQRCAVKPTDDILDVGSGCGRVAIPFTQFLTSGRYDGFDVMLPMVEWCQRNITARYPNFRFRHARLSNTMYVREGESAATYRFPYLDGCFDVAFATSVFTHLVPDSAMRYLSEISRVLKPSGRALLTFFIINDGTRAKLAAGADIMSFPFRRVGYALQSEDHPEAAIGYEETKALTMLNQAGLEIIEFSPGAWSQNPDAWTAQDAFLVTRSPAREA